MPVADLPTLRDVLKQCQLLLERHSSLNAYGSLAMAADVLPLFLDVWKRANAKLVALPIQISDDSLIRKVERKWRTLTNIAGKRGKVSEKQRSSFADELDKLFNILVCSCEFVNCSAAKCTEKDCTPVHIDCNCLSEGPT